MWSWYVEWTSSIDLWITDFLNGSTFAKIKFDTYLLMNVRIYQNVIFEFLLQTLAYYVQYYKKPPSEVFILQINVVSFFFLVMVKYHH